VAEPSQPARSPDPRVSRTSSGACGTPIDTMLSMLRCLCCGGSGGGDAEVTVMTRVAVAHPQDQRQLNPATLLSPSCHVTYHHSHHLGGPRQSFFR
jgi:hypothetical protein